MDKAEIQKLRNRLSQSKIRLENNWEDKRIVDSILRIIFLLKSSLKQNDLFFVVPEELPVPSKKEVINLLEELLNNISSLNLIETVIRKLYPLSSNYSATLLDQNNIETKIIEKIINNWNVIPKSKLISLSYINERYVSEVLGENISYKTIVDYILLNETFGLYHISSYEEEDGYYEIQFTNNYYSNSLLLIIQKE